MSIAECNATVPKNLNRIIKERGLKKNAVAQWAGLWFFADRANVNHKKTSFLSDSWRRWPAAGISIAEDGSGGQASCKEIVNQEQAIKKGGATHV